MKVKINTTLKGVDGVKELPNPETKSALTLKDILISSLLTPDEKDDEKKKFEKWEIFKKIRDAQDGEAELTIEEMALVKKGVGKFQPPLILGQCFELLEGK